MSSSFSNATGSLWGQAAGLLNILSWSTPSLKSHWVFYVPSLNILEASFIPWVCLLKGSFRKRVNSLPFINSFRKKEYFFSCGYGPVPQQIEESTDSLKFLNLTCIFKKGRLEKSFYYCKDRWNLLCSFPSSYRTSSIIFLFSS